ncbi:MAG TPA: pentapeptide repeat-containing protein [Thermomicrobiales bacterium]|nr:pentapeptide repeat-containing protein [Thermomicrobiales bacterium]
MDADRFDWLTRRQALAATRRQTLAGLAVLALPPGAARFGAPVAARRKPRRPKERQEECAAILTGKGCTKPSLIWVCPPNTSLRDTDLHGCILEFAVFERVDLTRASLTGADLTRAVFDGADLSEAKRRHVNGSNSSYVGGNMLFVELQHATLDAAHLDGADIAGATLDDAILHNATFTGATLAAAAAEETQLELANFQDPDLTKVRWDGTTCPDFARAAGHKGCCDHLNGAIPKACSCRGCGHD